MSTDEARELRRKPIIHQAIGMVIAQLDLGPDAALDRLRAYAASHNSDLVAVATAIVDRSLHLPREQA